MSIKMKKSGSGDQSSKKSLRYHRRPTPGKITIEQIGEMLKLQIQAVNTKRFDECKDLIEDLFLI